MDWRSFIEPFAKLPKTAVWGLLVAEAVVALVIWQVSGEGLIPGPGKIISDVFKAISSSALMEPF